MSGRAQEVSEIEIDYVRYGIIDTRFKDNSELSYTASWLLNKARAGTLDRPKKATEHQGERYHEVNTHQLKGIGSIRHLS